MNISNQLFLFLILFLSDNKLIKKLPSVYQKGARMTSEKNMLIAFLLNLTFAILEVIFGIIFHSTAVLSDALHDLGDAFAIFLSTWLEKISNKKPDHHYTLGYKPFSLLGALLTSLILISGSLFLILENISNLIHPKIVNYQGMFVLGLFALATNLLASYIVHKGKSHNERVLSLHFLEDILGWLALIFLSILLHFKPWYILDPLLSIAISLFILSKAIPLLWQNVKLLLGHIPETVNLAEIYPILEDIPYLQEINTFQVWSLDGLENRALIHIKLSDKSQTQGVKECIRKICQSQHIQEITIEIDS